MKTIRKLKWYFLFLILIGLNGSRVFAQNENGPISNYTEIVYLNLDAGNVTITSSTYEGYRWSGNTPVKISGTASSSALYYIYQARPNTSWGVGNPPRYPAVTTTSGATGSDALNIVNNTDVMAVINGWNAKVASNNAAQSNENYKRVSPVVFANNDGKTLRAYFKEALGIPETNIIYVEDASLADMKYNVELLKQRANSMGNDCEVIIYYAGHGIPDMTNKTAFLLPIDSYGTDTSTGYPLEEFYKTLSELHAKSVIVLLDACFSGAKREGDMLVAARGVAIKVKDAKPKGNLIVLSAAQGDETAYPYNNQKHGLFTYYFLRKLQETSGNATLGEIADYVKSEVLQKSIEMNGKSQTPTVSVSSSMERVWRNKKLK